jgi:small subunit ribosomal protein S1
LVVEGQISNIVDFGAFVDLDGIDGLIHISELSWSHVNHPSEILKIGDTVQVKVLDIDRDRQRISLGLKQTQEDPWQRIVDTYNIGDELEGKVTKVVTFGAFVEILDGVEGLVHISELAPHHVESPREVVHPDDRIRVKILEIDSERRRLSLSAKRVENQVLRSSRPDDADDDYDAASGEDAMLSEADADAPVTDNADTQIDAAAPADAEPAEAAAEPAEAAAEPAEAAAEPTEAAAEPTDAELADAEPAEAAADAATPVEFESDGDAVLAESEEAGAPAEPEAAASVDAVPGEGADVHDDEQANGRGSEPVEMAVVEAEDVASQETSE